MRIKKADIENFRCLDKVEVEFDQVTTFIGPNGAGKSSVLRALDWFFNGEKSVVLTDHDVFSGADEDKRIIVKVEFDQLTEKDRELLGSKYAPQGVDSVTIWRTWDSGKDKITGKALAFLPFEDVRRVEGATPRKQAYQQVIDAHSELEFPRWTSDAASEEMMTQWERDHPEMLEEAQVSATNFFGFAGQGKLSGLFDFVLITADMRAAEEAQDNKTSVIGRILEKAVDRSGADAELLTLSDELVSRHQEIAERHFEAQLRDLSTALTTEVANFATGRDIEIESIEPQFRPQVTRFEVRVDDHGTKTTVERQGHGFQRSLLVAALKLLAQRGAVLGDENVIFLAIEEPELFQHPAQAKSFASVLRKLAQDESSGIQIGYATHSPYFVEATYFDQVRRVERNVSTTTGPQVVINHASMDKVVSMLAGYIDETAVRNRLDNSCLNELRDALFGSAVLVVEGSTDKAIIEGIAEKGTALATNGIEVAVAQSKHQIFIPAAILTQLGIPFFTLFDSDSDIANRMRSEGKSGSAIATQVRENAEKNKNLLRFFGMPEQDWPSGIQNEYVGVVEDMLESVVASEWPEFEVERSNLVAADRGSDGKNAATYRLAARSAANPPSSIEDVINAVRSLVV